MKLKKVISGGQSGADVTALEEAQTLGLETGGIAPKGYRTESGHNFALRDRFGLKESSSPLYPPRTRQNVADADATIWFGILSSAGFKCTQNAAYDLHKAESFWINPTETQLVEIANRYETINVAGNRESSNPQVVELVRAAFRIFKKVQGDPDVQL